MPTVKLFIYACLILFLFTRSVPPKPCLCQKNEENVFSFQAVKSKKTLSVCVEKNRQYLVYRYGLPQKIELVFPQKLDQSSWGKFVYKGYTRGGGPANAAMSDQTLAFSNQGVQYEIYDHSGYEDETEKSYSHAAGVVIQVNGKEVDLKADMKSLSGGLENLTQYDQIENHYGE
jgi:hypothetical protein